MRPNVLALMLPACAALTACGGEPQPDRQAATAPAPTPSPPPPIDLARYTGAYPFDPVEGRRFVDEPAVRDAVRRLAPDPAFAARFFAEEGPRTPIRRHEGGLVSFGCETHNCGPHNWALLIALDGSDARLCYTPDGAAPRWFGGEPAGAPTDSCPSGDVG